MTGRHRARPDVTWLDEDVDTAGRAADLARAACDDIADLTGARNLGLTNGRQAAVDLLAAAHQELGRLLRRLAVVTR